MKKNVSQQIDDAILARILKRIKLGIGLTSNELTYLKTRKPVSAEDSTNARQKAMADTTSVEIKKLLEAAGADKN